MTNTNIAYADNDTSVGYFKVTYIVNSTGVELTQGFDSYFLCQRFVNKLRHSKKCTLVSVWEGC